MTQTYASWLRALFGSPNLDKEIQETIISDFSSTDIGAKVASVLDGPECFNFSRDMNSYPARLLHTARSKQYNILTRFVPPYCSTVTFYKDTVGFVTVSRLSASFVTHLRDIGDGFRVTQGALDTLQSAYRDMIRLSSSKHAASSAVPGQRFDNPRGKLAHEAAIKASFWPHNQIYVRLEWPFRQSLTTLTYDDDAQRNAKRVAQTKNNFNCSHECANFMIWGPVYLWRMIFHQLFTSHVSFKDGPAAVMNDFLYSTHDGTYACQTHLLGGELSARLNLCGKVLAFLNLSWINVIITGIVALTASSWASTDSGKITAAGILLSLLIWQMLWTTTVSSTTYENIVSDEIKLRRIGQGAALFGLGVGDMKLLLTMISSERTVYAHGNCNSYLNVAGAGVLDVSGPEPSSLLYLAGYITSSIDPIETDDTVNELERRPAIAAYVPHDTHRITYSSNDIIRRLDLVDNGLHLSEAGRSAIERAKSGLVYKHDGDEHKLPLSLRIYHYSIN